MTINMHQGDEAFAVHIEGSNASFNSDVESREEAFEASMTENDMQLEVSMEENEQTFDADMGEVQLVPGGSSEPGKDGFSPIVDLTETDEGVRITVVDAEGEETAFVRHGKDGYTPVKGKDYQDGKDGAPGDKGDPGEPGQPGADGISPVVTVQDITGGHRVTITDRDGATTFDVMDGTGGGGSGGSAIIDVVELPETGILEDAFYRLLTGKVYMNGAPQNTWTCYIVDTLPGIGVPVTTDMVHISLYYAVDIGSVWGYIPDALAGATGIPAGWYPVEVLAQAFGLQWGGIIWDETESPTDDNVFRLLLGYAMYCYKQEWVNLGDKVGWQSKEGVGAEIFNTLRNIASGDYSHAEGHYTTASGDDSHAEGYYTTASEESSHAEGYFATASGYNSHAEGHFATASGIYSHAEGYYTTASGESSHAEGEGTVTSGKAQHVQGRYNVVDETSQDYEGYRKYAHIVGNGRGGILSNAHTLDWNGVAWYQGRPQFGGNAQDDGAQTVMGNGDKEIVLASPNGNLWGITVTDDGVLTVTAK